MAKIISIGTSVPQYKHTQQQLLEFMEGAYNAGLREKRILSYLYKHSGIESRYSVIPDFTLPIEDWQFFPKSRDLEPFPLLDYRMDWYYRFALPLALNAVENCLAANFNKALITHVITVSCTGMSAPGLELQLVDALGLRNDITRTSINFMGCYAAIHGLKMANDIVRSSPESQVLVVCVELCSLHYQKTFTDDTITAPLIFGDGCAAVLIAADSHSDKGIRLDSFYSEILNEASHTMTWNLSATGFVMTLSADIPEIFHHKIGGMKDRALNKAGISNNEITYWCIHPGGKRILEAIYKGLNLQAGDLTQSERILREYGNMSSPTILFVLKAILDTHINNEPAKVFAVAFGPGLTMESVVLTIE